MREMNDNFTEIGLPLLSEDDLESLAEACENEVTNYLLSRIPQKSIEELSVSCSLEFTNKLDVDIAIDISQKYDNGQDLDVLVTQAAEFGMSWLEKELREMKGD